MENTKDVKLILKDMISELRDYYDEHCEYSKGYLDALFEFCHRMNIPACRTELNLHIGE
mgnify:CR=1 FL=1